MNIARNIILTGFMGVGKTSVGTRLAEDTGYAFVDTDELVEKDQGMAITEIFSSFGEPYFRDVETKIIQSVAAGEKQVVSTGGGAVIRDENRRALKAGGLVVCLTARPEVIFARIRHETHRPLLKTPDPAATIRDLLAARAAFYAAADMTIDTSERSIDEIVSAIKERIRHACC